MSRQPPRSTRPAPPFPYTTLFRSPDTWHADDVWRDRGAAGLLGAAVPEADGGLGFGLLEACLVAEEIGRRVAPLPYLSVAIGAALPIAAFGSEQQRNEHLPGLLDGSRLVTVRSEEHTSELQSLMRISYAVFCLQQKSTKE